MSTPIIISPGQMITKDPTDERVFKFDWTTYNIQEGVTITASTFTVTAVRPSKTDTALLTDNPNLPTQGCIRVKAGTLGQVYAIANKIVTNETPNQTKERAFLVKIEQK
jgi:hypothetical protein